MTLDENAACEVCHQALRELVRRSLQDAEARKSAEPARPIAMTTNEDVVTDGTPVYMAYDLTKASQQICASV